MMKPGSFFTILLLYGVLCTACKNKAEAVSPVIQGKDNLIGSWRLTEFVVNGIDVSNTLGICLLDDVFTFDEDAVFTHTIGVNKCDIEETDRRGTWTMNEDETTLITNVANPRVLTIISLSATRLELMFTSTEVVDGVTVDRENGIIAIKQ